MDNNIISKVSFIKLIFLSLGVVLATSIILVPADGLIYVQNRHSDLEYTSPPITLSYQYEIDFLDENGNNRAGTVVVESIRIHNGEKYLTGFDNVHNYLTHGQLDSQRTLEIHFSKIGDEFFNPPARYKAIILPSMYDDGIFMIDMREYTPTPFVVMTTFEKENYGFDVDDMQFHLIKSEFNDKCLDVYGEQTHEGATITIWDCHGNKNQQWKITDDGQIISLLTGKCLQVQKTSIRYHQHYVILAYCTPDKEILQYVSGLWYDESQLWHITESGEIMSIDTGKCIDIQRYAKYNGAPLKLWDCNGGDNQSWYIEVFSPCKSKIYCAGWYDIPPDTRSVSFYD